ncbi:hypothetical protein [Mesorhizobium sp. 1M-11]|uniref:hypothetical protein n=1 Tax=Mesorhizobium sp. 1M-11 TaxID=1529006 RepID=UPI0006C75C05|nr:hypothetical protein [Mesorhizobium sp. 1M-11]
MKQTRETGVNVMSEVIQALLDALKVATFQTLNRPPQRQDTYLRTRPERRGKPQRRHAAP